MNSGHKRTPFASFSALRAETSPRLSYDESQKPRGRPKNGRTRGGPFTRLVEGTTGWSSGLIIVYRGAVTQANKGLQISAIGVPRPCLLETLLAHLRSLLPMIGL